MAYFPLLHIHYIYCMCEEDFLVFIWVGLLSVKRNRRSVNKTAVIWVKCKIPLLIVHVSTLGELLPSFHYSECWEISDCRVRLYLTAVQFSHCRPRSLHSFGLHSRNILHLPCGAAKYKQPHCTVYISTVLTHK